MASRARLCRKTWAFDVLLFLSSSNPILLAIAAWKNLLMKVLWQQFIFGIHAGEQSKPFWTGKSFNLLFSLCSTYPTLHFMEILSWFLELFPYLNIFPPLKYEHSKTLHFHINPIFLFPQCEYSAVCHICWQLSLFWSTPTKSWTLFIHIIFGIT